MATSKGGIEDERNTADRITGDEAVRKPITPNCQIRSALRKLWLRSRERAAALKREAYTCERCSAKQSTAKGREVAVNVHHDVGIDWDGLIDLVRERMLTGPLTVLCKDCHDKEHGGK